MKLGDLRNRDVRIYRIVDYAADDARDWLIEPTTDDHLCNPKYGLYLVRAFLVDADGMEEGMVTLSVPGCSIDYSVVVREGAVEVYPYAEGAEEIVLGVGINESCDYTLFTSRRRSDLGVAVLEEAAVCCGYPAAICELLGYLFRDQGKDHEAAKWFVRACESGPSSPLVYLEAAGALEADEQFEEGRRLRAMYERWS